jgi:hypothetical protein
MAKKAESNQPGNGKNGGETVAGYFRTIFKQNPQLLKGKSNKELLDRWLKDHPDQKEVPKNVKASLSNLKSVLRSKRRTRVAERAEDRQAPGKRTHVDTVPTGSTELEALEHQIDECLIQAKTMNRKGLENVISHLRLARNMVVWKIGQ